MRSNFHLVKKFLFAYFVLFFLTSCNKKKETKFLNSIFFSGNKQAACWLLTEDIGIEDSSKKFTLRIISIPEEKLLATTHVNPKRLSSYFKESILHKIVVKGDRVWVIFPDSTIEARNILSGEVCETSEGIAQKFPKLRQDGKLLRMFQLNSDGFYLLDRNRSLNFYELSDGTLYTKEQWLLHNDTIINAIQNDTSSQIVMFKNPIKQIELDQLRKTIKILDLKNNHQVYCNLKKEINYQLFNNSEFLVFFQNQLLIQDKKSIKFAACINPVNGQTLWQAFGDSIFNRLERNKQNFD